MKILTNKTIVLSDVIVRVRDLSDVQDVILAEHGGISKKSLIVSFVPSLKGMEPYYTVTDYYGTSVLGTYLVNTAVNTYNNITEKEE